MPGLLLACEVIRLRGKLIILHRRREGEDVGNIPEGR